MGPKGQRSISKVSVIIVNYNGLKWLRGCLLDLGKQDHPNLEVVIVDNGSSDGSVNFIQKKYPHYILVKLSTNRGFAAANNEGWLRSTGNYIILLNNDTRIAIDYVSSFLKVFERYPKCGAAQSKIVFMGDTDRLDSCGSYITSTTFQYYIGNGKNASDHKYNIPFPIFSTKGASMIIKKEVIKKIGLFDPDYWSYYEETDFCHRAWIAGYQVWYWPATSVEHAVGGTSVSFPNSFVQYHNYKNKLASLLVNFEAKSLIKYIPVFFVALLVIMLAWLLNGKIRHALMLVNSIVWNVVHLPQILTKRKKVQAKRKIGDQDISKIVLKNPRPSYYYYLFTDKLSTYVD